jgi:hypothetical protein
MPRFVVLEHDHPSRHWDLMLEEGPSLWSWRLPAPPGPGVQQAERTPDHRLLYLDYEGPVSGNRGKVVRWDAGEFSWRAREPGRLEVELHGQRLRGTLVLIEEDGNWSAEFSDFQASGGR